MEIKLFLVTLLIYFSSIFFQKTKYFKKLLCLGLAIQFFGILLRIIFTEHLPFATVYEVIMSVSWLGLITSLLIDYNYKIAITNYSIYGIIILMGSANFFPVVYKIGGELSPLLRNYWFLSHVFLAIIAYCFFLISFGISSRIILSTNLKEQQQKKLDKINVSLIFWAVLFLSMVLIIGSFWAKKAWGRYWSWDPKETAALLTLISYSAALVFKKIYKLSPRIFAVFSLASFILLLITFIGVSIFMPGLHSY